MSHRKRWMGVVRSAVHRGVIVLCGGAAAACGSSVVGEDGTGPEETPPGIPSPKEQPACAEHWGGEGNASCTTCGCDDPGWSCAISTCMSPAGTVRALGDEAGFFTLESYHYAAKSQGLAGQMARARLFYAFQPADEDAQDKPLFVFFNGGPGAATMDMLFAFNTSKRTLDTDPDADPPWRDNPHSFTRAGNVLYVDTRDAGFSYGLPEKGWHESVAPHPGVDAADVLRVILRFLDRHEPLRDNPVVLVGESWGGARANLIASMVRQPDALRSATALYEDPALADEIEAHFALAFPASAGQPPSELLILQQFGWQVLIQPVVMGFLQRQAQDSLYTPSPLDWEEEMARMDRVSALMQDYDVVRAMLGVDPAEIRDLRPEARVGARRDSCDREAAPGSWAAVLGKLGYRDCYFRTYARVWFDPYAGPDVPTAFVGNLGRVRTLITDARLDRIVISPAIVEALRTQPHMFDRVEVVTEPGKPRSTRIHVGVTEATSEELGIPREVWIAFPAYESGHSVPMYQPGEFLQDVEAWW